VTAVGLASTRGAPSGTRNAGAACALLAGTLAACSAGSSSAGPDGGEQPMESGTIGSDDGAGSGQSDAGGNVEGSASHGDGSSGDSAQPGDAEASSDAAGDAGSCQVAPKAASPVCFSSFAQIGPMMVTTTCASGGPPTAQGGTIPAGEYFLESRTGYGSSCQPGPDRAATIIVCNDEWDWGIGYGPASTFFYQYAVTHPQPTALTLTPVCTTDLDTTVDNLTYSVAGSVLTVSDSSSGPTYVSTYRKQ
jgi:hypothetical protein